MIGIWKKFIPCDCQSEGIMISYEYQNTEGALPFLDLAFFRQSFYGSYPLTLRERIRCCWRIITKGEVYNDMVILSKENAEILAKELMVFVKSKPKKQRKIDRKKK